MLTIWFFSNSAFGKKIYIAFLNQQRLTALNNIISILLYSRWRSSGISSRRKSRPDNINVFVHHVSPRKIDQEISQLSHCPQNCQGSRGCLATFNPLRSIFLCKLLGKLRLQQTIRTDRNSKQTRSKSVVGTFWPNLIGPQTVNWHQSSRRRVNSKSNKRLSVRCWDPGEGREFLEKEKKKKTKTKPSPVELGEHGEIG